MSLFKARDWWATYAGSDEEFDLGCLCVANIDNNASEFGKFAKDLFTASISKCPVILWVSIARTEVANYKKSNGAFLFHRLRLRGTSCVSDCHA